MIRPKEIKQQAVSYGSFNFKLYWSPNACALLRPLLMLLLGLTLSILGQGILGAGLFVMGLFLSFFTFIKESPFIGFWEDKVVINQLYRCKEISYEAIGGLEFEGSPTTLTLLRFYHKNSKKTLFKVPTMMDMEKRVGLLKFLETKGVYLRE